jgi:hypothetical protein
MTDREPVEFKTNGVHVGPFFSATSREVTAADRRRRERRNAWIWVAVAVFLLLTGNWYFAIPAAIWATLSVAGAMTQTPTKETDR